MLSLVLLLVLFPSFIQSAGEGNIHLLEEEIAVALKACITPKDDHQRLHKQRQKRSENCDGEPRIDNNSKQEANPYGHQRRNPNDMEEKLQSIPNITKHSVAIEDSGNENKSINRTERGVTLTNKADTDQVDSQGIPHEAELWNVIQSSVTSQQSRAALRDQLRACFQEVQSEAEDNGCSYSNKLEHCLMLRFSDRKVGDDKIINIS